MPLECESTLYQQKPSQVYVNDGDAEMKEADQNTSQHAYKKTKINYNKDNEDLDDLLSNMSLKIYSAHLAVHVSEVVSFVIAV